MSLDGLPQQFDAFVERARTALSQQITSAQKIVAAAKAETATAQTSLSELQDQHMKAKAQLDTVLKHLDRGSTLVGLNTEIKEARKALDAVKAETAEATTALEALKKQRADASAKLAALTLEANRMIAIRTEGEAVMAGLRAKLAQVQIGQRP
jgi:chromosome segregation ATPase